MHCLQTRDLSGRGSVAMASDGIESAQLPWVKPPRRWAEMVSCYGQLSRHCCCTRGVLLVLRRIA